MLTIWIAKPNSIHTIIMRVNKEIHDIVDVWDYLYFKSFMIFFAIILYMPIIFLIARKKSSLITKALYWHLVLIHLTIEHDCLSRSFPFNMITPFNSHVLISHLLEHTWSKVSLLTNYPYVCHKVFEKISNLEERISKIK